MANASACERGWSDHTCFTSCADDPGMLHEAAGVIQVGGQSPRTAYYLPNGACVIVAIVAMGGEG